MGKRSQRRRVRLEKDQAGCMWGLISIFDFRHARFTRKLLLDRKRGSRHPVGAGYPRTKLKMLTYYDEKYQNTEDIEENEPATTDALKTSVKELMEEEMFGEQGLKKNMSNARVQLNQSTSENGGQVRVKPTQAKEYRSKSCDMHIIDLDGAENSSHQVLDQETSNNLDMEIILEELCRLNPKGSCCLKHDLHDDVNMESNQVHSAVEEKLGAAIKVFISQRFSNDKHLTEDGKTHHSEEFMDALQTLSSNKELFFELLQDPNSQLVKHIQSVEDAHLDKDQNNCSLSRSNLLEEEPSKPRPDELTNRKPRSFFRRRSKSQDSNSLKDTDKLIPSSRIVILKPGPASPQNSGIGSIGSTSVESSHSMDNNKPQSERNASQFSLHEIKRKLKHAMGKERHGISLFHEKGVGEGNGGWGSPNRNHFYTERFAKSPVGTKRGDKISKSKESETILMNETVENPKQVVSKIYVEAKKHLSEMLSNGVEKEELMGRQLPKTLGRILSLPEYSFTPLGSPGKDREHNFVTAQMRLSPHSNFHMVNENTWRIIQENHAIQLSSPKQNLESRSCISDDKSDEKVQSLNSNPDVSCELNHDNAVEETTSSMREENACEELPESVRNSNSEFQEDIQVSDGESSIPLFNREMQICDAAEVYDDEGSLKSVKLDSIEKDELLSSPPVSPPSPSITRKVETPDTCTERAERPSPISVLEPLFSEDDISPSSTKTKPVATAIQPLQIHFEEPVSCDADQAICTITCMEDEESSFEYVEAVLLGSGLNWDEYLLRWLSSDELLDPSLFDEVELFSSRSSHDQKLLFDCTNEVLTEVCKRYFSRSFVKQAIQPVPKGMKLINEVWEGVEWHILQHPAPHSLDQLLRKDMSKSGTWMDLHFETDHIVIELEKSILEELLEDTILISDNNSIKDKFSILPDEMIENEEVPVNI